MPEPTQFMFTFKELAALMVREQGITEGLWGVHVKFGLAAANIGEGEGDVRPTAVIPILEIGLQRFEKASNLTVDAAELNQASSTKVRRSRKKGAP